MRRAIGGVLDYAALAGDRNRYRPLDRDSMRVAVREMSARGMSDHTIAAATQLSVEQVRRLIGGGARMSSPTVMEYFGGCPECGRNDGYLNVRSAHAMVCDRHRVYWWVGSNLFSGWRDEAEDVWRANAAKLDRYREVEPLPEGAPIPRPGPALLMIQGGKL